MARVQAKNYGVKREIIIDKAGRLFSKSGYPNIRMMDIADACGASKSMLYHYFPKKENLLMAILTDHMEDMTTSIVKLTKAADKTPRELVQSFVELFVLKSARARPKHLVAMLDVKYLPKSDQAIVRAMEREIVTLTSSILKLANPNIDESDYNMYSLLLIGTINSLDTWSKSTGHYSNKEMAAKIAELFLDGFLET